MAKSPNWANEELEVLKDKYPLFGTQDIMLMFLPGRSKKSISIKASRLGIKVASPWNKHKTTEEYSAEVSHRNIEVLEPYVNDETKIRHRCTYCNNIWISKPNNILNGSGCPACNKGFGSKWGNKDNLPEKAKIYLLQLDLPNGDSCLKIGITSNLCNNKRYNQIKYESRATNLQILYEYEASGEAILNLEHDILTDSNITKYKTTKSFRGSTELLDLSMIDTVVRKIKGS